MKNYTIQKLCDHPKRVYQVNQNGRIANYLSVTTILKFLPQNPFLTQWAANQGSEEQRLKTLEVAAHFGTLMHALIERLIITPDHQYTMLEIDFETNEYIKKEGLFLDCKTQNQWTSLLYKYIASFIKFVQDMAFVFDGQHFGVEETVFFEKTGDYKMGWAGSIDLWYVKDRVLYIVDLKSSKQIYDSYGLQCFMYFLALTQNVILPEFENTKLIVWRPKDWMTDPTYETKVWDLKSNFTDFQNRALSVTHAASIELTKKGIITIELNTLPKIPLSLSTDLTTIESSQQNIIIS